MAEFKRTARLAAFVGPGDRITHYDHAEGCFTEVMGAKWTRNSDGQNVIVFSFEVKDDMSVPYYEGLIVETCREDPGSVAPAFLSKPPRAPHSVFGPVPRGWLPLTDETGGGDPRLTLVPLDIIDGIVPCGSGSKIEFHHRGNGAAWWRQFSESPAEVSRLIAEAQGDE